MRSVPPPPPLRMRTGAGAAADLRAAARTTRDKRVIYVVGWHRRVRNDGIAKGACLVSRCHGMLFAPAPRLVEDVRAAAAAARPYTCVNVRTEMTNAVGNPHCPGHIHAAAARAWAALPEAANGTKLIISDAYASTTVRKSNAIEQTHGAPEIGFPHRNCCRRTY